MVDLIGWLVWFDLIGLLGGWVVGWLIGLLASLMVWLLVLVGWLVACFFLLVGFDGLLGWSVWLVG